MLLSVNFLSRVLYRIVLGHAQCTAKIFMCQKSIPEKPQLTDLGFRGLYLYFDYGLLFATPRNHQNIGRSSVSPKLQH